jgi:hypothetical protein
MRLSKARTLTLAGVAVAAGATTAGLLASSATAAPAAHEQSGPSYQVRDILYGWNMKHKNSDTGKSEELSDPAGLAQYGGNLYASFTNGVGAQGQASTSGNVDSTIVEFTSGGSVVAQWDVAGQAQALTANPATGEVIAAVNPAGNSSLYSIEPGGQVIHYAYSKALASKGGTGEATYDGSQLLVTASQPTAPAWSSPAVYSVSLDQTTKVATIKPFYWDNSPARIANDPGGVGDPLGTNVTLGLSPSSISVLGSTSPRFAKHVVVSSGSSEVIGSGSAGLWDLKTAQPVGDVAVVTQWNGDLYATNPVTDTVNVVGYNKAIWPGTVFVAVNPGSSSARVEQLNLQSGQLLSYGFWGVSLQPQDLLYVPSSGN